MIDINKYDFKNHNQEVTRVWRTYDNGHPVRVPMILGLNVRYFLLNPTLNPQKIIFKEYLENPDIMFETQVKFDYWGRFHLLSDRMMGLPEEGDGWNVEVDFQNHYEAVWFGCPLYYFESDVPDVKPILKQ
jgi:hypothetical protein